MKFQTKHLNDINPYFYRTPLHIAIDNKSSEIVKLLLQNKEININEKNKVQFNFWMTFWFNADGFFYINSWKTAMDLANNHYDLNEIKSIINEYIHK